jgi:hypothetical protein
MSRGLAEQIALLDGLDGNFISIQDQINASNGGNWSGGSNYEGDIPLMTSSIGLAGMQGLSGDQDVINQYNAINASNGGNWSGGSNYEGDIPLMTSSIGLAGMNLADAELLAYANGIGQIPGTLPERFNVIDASGGANYSGGASYSPGLPLLPSRAGLAGPWSRFGRPSPKPRAGIWSRFGRPSPKPQKCSHAWRLKIKRAYQRASAAGDRFAAKQILKLLRSCPA